VGFRPGRYRVGGDSLAAVITSGDMAFVAPVPLDPGDVSAAADVLVRSFADDPGLHFVLPDAADRERLGSSLAHAVIRYALRCGTPLATAGKVRGVALWFPPDAPAPTGADLAETGLAAVPDQIGPDAWGRFQRLLDHLDALHPRYAPEPHWYLAMLGVDPAWQRQGLGEALLRPIFAMADRDGLCCYLEAPTERVPRARGDGYPRERGSRLADAARSGGLMASQSLPGLCSGVYGMRARLEIIDDAADGRGSPYSQAANGLAQPRASWEHAGWRRAPVALGLGQ
jgi:ribosomal protein S18 acetylase RimI-like enzyme